MPELVEEFRVRVSERGYAIVAAKEYPGGFWIIEAPDLDKAIEYAKLGSKALQSRIEVRPFQEEPPQDES